MLPRIRVSVPRQGVVDLVSTTLSEPVKICSVLRSVLARFGSNECVRIDHSPEKAHKKYGISTAEIEPSANTSGDVCGLIIVVESQIPTESKRVVRSCPT